MFTWFHHLVYVGLQNTYRATNLLFRFLLCNVFLTFLNADLSFLAEHQSCSTLGVYESVYPYHLVSSSWMSPH